MKVINISNTTKLFCSPIVRLEYWKNFSNATVNMCTAKGCRNNDLVGALVRKEGSLEALIIPFCQKHNLQQNEKWIEIEQNTVAVPIER